MKFKCIKNEGCQKFLTLGKIYDGFVTKSEICPIGIICDDGEEGWFRDFLFEKIEE